RRTSFIRVLQAFKVSNFTLARLQLSDTAIKRYVEEPQRYKKGTASNDSQASLLCVSVSLWFLTYRRFGLLSRELDAFLQQLLISVGVNIVLGADVLFEPCTFSQHESRTKRPRLREDVWIIHGHFVVDLILVNTSKPLCNVQGILMECACAGEPGLVIEAGNIDDQSVTLPAANRIAHVTGNDVVGMFRVQRNHAENVHVFVEHDDLRGRLDNLLWEETQHHSPRQTCWQTLRRGVINASSVKGLQNFLRGPWLIRGALATGRAVIGR